MMANGPPPPATPQWITPAYHAQWPPFSPRTEHAVGALPEFPDFYWQVFCNLLIKEDFRNLPWSIGVMEYWNDGLRGEKNNRSMPFDSSTQYSSFPLFHHSMWMAPLLQQIALMDNGVLDKIEETPGALSLIWHGT
jgi:hypothetical protein